MPKIIQIIQTHNGLIALCNDGSIWSCKITHLNTVCHDWVCIHDVNKHFDDEIINGTSEIKEPIGIRGELIDIEEYHTKLEAYNINIENLEKILETYCHFPQAIVQSYDIDKDGIVKIIFFDKTHCEKSYTIKVDKLCTYLNYLKDKNED